MVSPMMAAARGEQLPVGWPWRFLMLSFLVAATAGMAAVGLQFGYKPFLESNLAAQQANLEGLGKRIPQDEQDKLVRFYSQLVNLQGILKNHAVVSPIFGFIESRTNVAVSYASLEAHLMDRKAVLEGTAQNYAIFAAQLQAFSSSPEVESVIVNDSSAQAGAVRFRITLTMRPSAFNTPL